MINKVVGTFYIVSFTTGYLSNYTSSWDHWLIWEFLDLVFLFLSNLLLHSTLRSKLCCLTTIAMQPLSTFFFTTLCSKNHPVLCQTRSHIYRCLSCWGVEMVYSLIKKENKIFLIYKRKGFLIYEEIRKYIVIYEEAVSHIWFATAPFWISLYMRKI